MGKSPERNFDPDMQMFKQAGDVNLNHLKFLRLLAEQERLEHKVAGPSSGPLSEEFSIQPLGEAKQGDSTDKASTAPADPEGRVIVLPDNRGVVPVGNLQKNLSFIRWLAVNNKLEHAPAGPPSGEFHKETPENPGTSIAS
jgi:hypothetical protein